MCQEQNEFLENWKQRTGSFAIAIVELAVRCIV